MAVGITLLQEHYASVDSLWLLSSTEASEVTRSGRILNISQPSSKAWGWLDLRPRDWKCFDGDTGKDSAREIREYFIPDFSNWKDHDSYQAAFQRLIRGLKAG